MNETEWTKDTDNMELHSQLCHLPGVFCGHVTYAFEASGLLSAK